MVYPLLAAQYANDNLTKYAEGTLLDMGIEQNKTNMTSNSITLKIRACPVDYCASVPGCQGSFSAPTQLTPDVDTTDWDFAIEASDLVDSICTYISFPVNPDIGGIGVQRSKYLVWTFANA